MSKAFSSPLSDSKDLQQQLHTAARDGQLETLALLMALQKSGGDSELIELRNQAKFSFTHGLGDG